MKSRSTRVLAAVMMLLLTAAACSAPSSKEEPLPSTTEFSQLTPAGIEQIKTTRHARFDLRNHDLTKSSVGTEGETMGPIIGGADQPMITLELLGPDRTETVETNTIAVVSTGPASEPYEDIVFWRSLDTPQQANEELRDGITRWGFNPARVSRWEENSQSQSDYRQVVSMGIGPSGLVMEVEAYLQAGKPLLRYIVHFEPRLYTPEVLDRIRSTGLSR